MAKKLVFLLLINLILAFNEVKVYAAESNQNAQNTKESSSQTSAAKGSSDQFKKWFLYLGAGIVPQPKFDSGIQSSIDNGKQANSWAGEYGGVLELPGLYYQIGESNLVGVIANFIFENYAKDFRLRQSLGYDTYNISLSAMTSSGPQPGLGYFARLDLGPCDLVEVTETGNTYSRSYFPGFFEQIVFGYGFQSSAQSRMLIHLNAFYEDVIEHYQTGVSFNIGFLL